MVIETEADFKYSAILNIHWFPVFIIFHIHFNIVRGYSFLGDRYTSKSIFHIISPFLKYPLTVNLLFKVVYTDKCYFWKYGPMAFKKSLFTYETKSPSNVNSFHWSSWSKIAMLLLRHNKCDLNTNPFRSFELRSLSYTLIRNVYVIERHAKAYISFWRRENQTNA